MRWIEAVIQTSAKEIDSLCEQLAALGVDGISIEDETDFQSFLENNQKYWDYVDEALTQRFAGRSRVKFYLPDDEDGNAALKRVNAHLGVVSHIRIYYDDVGLFLLNHLAPVRIDLRILPKR